MTEGGCFEEVATELVGRLGATSLRTLADRLRARWPEQAILGGTRREFVEPTRAILTARRTSGISAEQAAGFLQGLAAGYARRSTEVGVETVWSGPGSHSVPVRATAQALVDLITEASRELILMTYSARPHEALRQALTEAVGRGVAVTVVVETLQGAGGALGGAEPAAAFSAIDGIELWHWPVAQRAEPSSKMHAKLAVADRNGLLTSSANLTQSGVDRNIEAGLLVRGGTVPARVAEHLTELMVTGTLQRLASTPRGGRG